MLDKNDLSSSSIFSSLIQFSFVPFQGNYYKSSRYYQALTLELQCSLCGRGYNGCSKDSNGGPSHLKQASMIHLMMMFNVNENDEASSYSS